MSSSLVAAVTTFRPSGETVKAVPIDRDIARADAEEPADTDDRCADLAILNRGSPTRSRRRPRFGHWSRNGQSASARRPCRPGHRRCRRLPLSLREGRGGEGAPRPSPSRPSVSSASPFSRIRAGSLIWGTAPVAIGSESGSRRLTPSRRSDLRTAARRRRGSLRRRRSVRRPEGLDTPTSSRASGSLGNAGTAGRMVVATFVVLAGSC